MMDYANYAQEQPQFKREKSIDHVLEIPVQHHQHIQQPNMHEHMMKMEQSPDLLVLRVKSEIVTQSSTPRKSQASTKIRKSPDSSKQYKCTECLYSFIRRDHLVRHQLTHSKVKPYTCGFCDKGFTRNDHLRRHIQRIHQSQEASMMPNSNLSERFVCQECKAIFSSNGHLSRHMESQHYEEFANISSQNISQNASSTYVMVNGKRRPLCDLCNKSFSKRDHLTRHIRNVHAGINITNYTTNLSAFAPPALNYQCSHCVKNFSRSDFLRRHLEDEHPSEAQQSNGMIQGQPEYTQMVPQENYMFHNDTIYGAPINTIPDPPLPKPPKTKKEVANRAHPCVACNKTFTRAYHLKRHQKSLHPGEFPS
ncbi:unnamed protein product [Diamesa hyperborea]